MDPTRKRKPVLIAAALAGGLLLACLACAIISTISKDSSQPARQARAELTSPPPSPSPVGLQPARTTAAATQVPAASATPGPTATPEPTATPTPRPMGMSRSSPAPVGEAVQTDDQFVLTVKGAKRGQEAWADIHNQNMFNSEPGEGKEYVLVTIGVGFMGDPDETGHLLESYFRLVGDRGVIYTAPLMLTLEQGMGMELFGGGVGVGQVAFEVARGEKDLVIIYSGAGTKARYLATGE